MFSNRFPLAASLCLLTAVALTGCGAPKLIFGTSEDYLVSTYDVLTRPNDEVLLRVRVTDNQWVQPASGMEVAFFRDADDEEPFATARTDSQGYAAVPFTPTEPGGTTFVVQARPENEPPVRGAHLYVAARRRDAPQMVIDLDKTVVGSGFHTVLMGSATPMPHSVDVVQRLARDYEPIYLTHRPDYFGYTSKSWLRRMDYPPGPLLLSSLNQFLIGSGRYKTGRIQDLMTTFDNIRIGVGDKLSDVEAYHENGLKAFLIVQIEDRDAESLEDLAAELDTLDREVQIITDWRQVEEAVYGDAAFPRPAFQERLRRMAREMDGEDEDKDEEEDDDDDDD